MQTECVYQTMTGGRMPNQSLDILCLIYEGARNGMPYSIRELMDATGIISPNGVMFHVAKLESHGMIRREPRLARTLVPAYKFIPASKIMP